MRVRATLFMVLLVAGCNATPQEVSRPVDTSKLEQLLDHIDQEQAAICANLAILAAEAADKTKGNLFPTKAAACPR